MFPAEPSVSTYLTYTTPSGGIAPLRPSPNLILIPLSSFKIDFSKTLSIDEALESLSISVKITGSPF